MLKMAVSAERARLLSSKCETLCGVFCECFPNTTLIAIFLVIWRPSIARITYIEACIIR